MSARLNRSLLDNKPQMMDNYNKNEKNRNGYIDSVRLDYEVKRLSREEKYTAAAKLLFAPTRNAARRWQLWKAYRLAASILVLYALEYRSVVKAFLVISLIVFVLIFVAIIGKVCSELLIG